jgi:PKD repeat protein
MKKLLLIAAAALMLTGTVSAQRQTAKVVSTMPAQRTCGTGILPDEYENWISAKMQEDAANHQGSRIKTVYNLPVVVHVIHNGTAVGSSMNISDAQVLSQIEALNEDYRKLNADTSSIPSVFAGLAADCEINFCLAQTDPNGQPTNGIDRINRNTLGWTAPPYAKTYVDATIKPATVWDVNKYLNIWVCNLSGGLLGYATFPPSSTNTGLSAPFGTATSDGVVILYNSFGRVGTVSAPYNKGRTATHEIGHWLGLRHINGDANCSSDYCNDTPTQASLNLGCPNFPKVSCSNGPNGDMFMNYMDYTDDACMFMFTPNQKARMVTTLTHTPFRVNLAASNRCNPPVVAAPVAAFTSNVTSVAVGGSVNFTDQSTNSPTSWSWTFAGGTPATSTSQNPSGVVYNAAGTYAVTLTATNANGSNTLTQSTYITVTGGTTTSSCDTVSNFNSATMTPSILGSLGWGYVSGHNDYLDVAKADKFAIAAANSTIDGTYLSFGIGSSSGTGQTATVKVWGEAAGLPSGVLGTATISYDSIAANAAAGTQMWVDFTPDIPVSVGNVYVGVEFGYTAGDTLALVHCADAEITTGTAYELWGDGTWHPYSELNTGWGINVAHLINPVICTSGTSSNSSCDSITNWDVAGMTPSILGSLGWGYVSGHNDYLDVAKADKYTVTGTGLTVDGTYMTFGIGSSSGTGQTATVKVWSDAAGLPSTMLGSATISYDSIAAYAASGSEMWVDFTPDVPVTAGSIYVGVEFGYTPGDTLAIVHCADAEIATGTAYELWSDGTWHPYSELNTGWGVNVAHLIRPVVCSSTSVGVAENTLGAVNLFPNPTRGELTVVLSDVTSASDISFRIFNMVGAEVLTTSLPSNGNGTYHMDLSHLSQGLYFVEINNATTKTVQKIQILK